jgi:hypothetical protein
VGGAITHFRRRPLESRNTGEATGTRKEARGCAATVGIGQSESPTPVVTEAVGTGKRQDSLGKELPRSAS